jgi:hypothetical protein
VVDWDGGGKAQSIGKPVAGRQRVTRLLVVGLRKGGTFGASLRLAGLNGQPGDVMYDAEGRVVGVVGVDTADGRRPDDPLCGQSRQAWSCRAGV